MPLFEIVEADLNRKYHKRAVLELVNAYAMDPMGDGKPLSAEVRRDLIPGLRQHPTTIIFLAFQRDEVLCSYRSPWDAAERNAFA